MDSGLLNIDKPAGMTSRDVVDHVQRLVYPAKVGHAGTLDPLATGVLIVCIGRATRLVPLIQAMHKTYRATFLLGRTSDTDDVEGTVVETPNAPRPSREQILAALPAFIGRIEQRPPAYSAVKVKGKRAHALARQGRDVMLPPKLVDVFRIELLRFDEPELELEIECGSGTYVRSLGRDLGERLGCGAVMSALVRMAIGPFRLESAVPLKQLTWNSVADFMLPMASAVQGRPSRQVDEAAVRELSHGRSITLVGEIPPAAGERVALLDERGELVALADALDGRLVPRQVFAAPPGGD